MVEITSDGVWRRSWGLQGLMEDVDRRDALAPEPFHSGCTPFKVSLQKEHGKGSLAQRPAFL